ncbi:hypothetical protein A0O00_01280 [Proteus mirabilis]|nr:hypothetical protein A0O00_01280 [Proteus mirabilis]
MFFILLTKYGNTAATYVVIIIETPSIIFIGKEKYVSSVGPKKIVNYKLITSYIANKKNRGNNQG